MALNPDSFIVRVFRCRRPVIRWHAAAHQDRWKAILSVVLDENHLKTEEGSGSAAEGRPSRHKNAMPSGLLVHNFARKKEKAAQPKNVAARPELRFNPSAIA